MWIWIHRFLMNRKNVGPELEADVSCGIPACKNPASDQWMPSTCALREAGVEVDWVAVCNEHDVQLNEDTVRFFFGDKYDTELAAYRQRRLG